MDTKPNDIPDSIAQLVGGPFDGVEEHFNPRDWQPDEVRYHLFHERGIIDDLTMFSKNFPSGAVYRWHPQDRVWYYLGLPSQTSQEGVLKLFEAFGVQPRDDKIR